MKMGWTTKLLDEICDVEYGTRVVNKRDGGKIYPVYGGGGATFFMDHYNRENCLVVARFAMSEQCTRFVKGRFFLNDSGLTIKPKNENVLLQDFLGLHILFLNDYIYSLARGTAQKNLNVPAFRKVEISYPDSLSEQHRIVTILGEAFAAIAKAKANAEKNLQNAKELFESCLQGVFEKKGEDWEEKALGEIASFRNGMNFTKGSKGERIEIVGVKDFQKSFWVPIGQLDSVTIDGKLNEVDLLKDDDILAVRSNGNPELIGRTLLAAGVKGKVAHSGFTIRIRLNSKGLFPVYLCHYLKTRNIRKELVEGGTGVNIKSLNQGTLSSLIVYFPMSISEQMAIVEKVESLSIEARRLESTYKQKLNYLEELKKSILHKAFNGELKATAKELV